MMGDDVKNCMHSEEEGSQQTPVTYKVMVSFIHLSSKSLGRGAVRYSRRNIGFGVNCVVPWNCMSVKWGSHAYLEGLL